MRPGERSRSITAQPTRRTFLGATAGALSLGVSPLLAAPAASVAENPPATAPALEEELRELLAKRPFLTPIEKFGGFVRERPAPFELPPEKLREIGLDRETWKLEVVPEGEAK